MQISFLNTVIWLGLRMMRFELGLEGNKRISYMVMWGKKSPCKGSKAGLYIQGIGR